MKLNRRMLMDVSLIDIGRVQIYGFSTDRPVLEVTNVAPEYRFFTTEQKSQYCRMLCEKEASMKRGGSRAMVFPIDDYELYIISYDKESHYEDRKFQEINIGKLCVRLDPDPELIEYVKMVLGVR